MVHGFNEPLSAVADIIDRQPGIAAHRMFGSPAQSLWFYQATGIPAMDAASPGLLSVSARPA